MKYQNTEEITKAFVKDGWNSDVSFKEVSLDEAMEKGYAFAVSGIRKGRKYFMMNRSGNIFNDNGQIAMYNIPTVSEKKKCKRVNAELLKMKIGEIKLTPSFNSSYPTGIKDAVLLITQLTDDGAVDVNALVTGLKELELKPSLFSDYGSALEKVIEITNNLAD